MIFVITLLLDKHCLQHCSEWCLVLEETSFILLTQRHWTLIIQRFIQAMSFPGNWPSWLESVFILFFLFFSFMLVKAMMTEEKLWKTLSYFPSPGKFLLPILTRNRSQWCSFISFWLTDCFCFLSEDIFGVSLSQNEIDLHIAVLFLCTGSGHRLLDRHQNQTSPSVALFW